MERKEIPLVRMKKFNSGKGAILCNNCRVIVKQGNGITKEDWESTEPLYCVKCQLEERFANIGGDVPDS
jgi:hypothetical protein